MQVGRDVDVLQGARVYAPQGALGPYARESVAALVKRLGGKASENFVSLPPPAIHITSHARARARAMHAHARSLLACACTPMRTCACSWCAAHPAGASCLKYGLVRRLMCPPPGVPQIPTGKDRTAYVVVGAFRDNDAVLKAYVQKDTVGGVDNHHPFRAC